MDEIDIMSVPRLTQIEAAIREIPDFPRPGIRFKDITPVLGDPVLLKHCQDLHLEAVEDLRGSIDVVVGIEARGFLFGPSLASAIGAAFAPMRKPGKLPAETVEQAYALEYGTNTVQLHRDAIARGQGVLLVDDLLATGGTASAGITLIESLGGRLLGCLFMVELTFLNGRASLGEYRIDTLVRY